MCEMNVFAHVYKSVKVVFESVRQFGDFLPIAGWEKAIMGWCVCEGLEGIYTCVARISGTRNITKMFLISIAVYRRILLG